MAQDNTWQDLLRQAACMSPKKRASVDRTSPVLNTAKEHPAFRVEERLDWESGAVPDSFQQQLEVYLNKNPLLRACDPSPNSSPSGSHALNNHDCQIPLSRVQSDAAIAATGTYGAPQMPSSACPSAVPSRQLSLAAADSPASSPPPGDGSALEALLEVLSSPNQGATLTALIQIVAQLVKDPQTAQLLAEATGVVGAEQAVVPAQPAMSDCPCSSIGSNNDVEHDEPSTADSAPQLDDQLNHGIKRTVSAMCYPGLEGAKKRLRFQ